MAISRKIGDNLQIKIFTLNSGRPQVALFFFGGSVTLTESEDHFNISADCLEIGLDFSVNVPNLGAIEED